ncbi:MAG: 30S ribosomal protein S16 [Nitrospirota bacterium]|nr:30S ribosomal protein S16 [Nitrospirota bacterium]MDE3017996.1 30S ribosomal protein S16 [Nitrospirota bacterium]MDE3034895.1 30S ribosomal protein S16 [Nitrospirota bacterium]MDE3119043.1 30S ribosomal protein S16 [Nitrospirota bacterium]MDE3226767.1 30S ribosomal protein S16 [Nitrospirota bacterium]
MAVHLRLTRAGRHKLPFYRVVAADSRKPRDGKYLEVLGTYDTLKNPPVIQLKQERVLDWLKKGAQPSVTVRTVLRRSGLWKQFEESRKAKPAS